MTAIKLLFTPGPLTTSPSLKAAMLRDAGSRDADFLVVVRSIRNRLLAIGGAAPGGDYECGLMQGSGTFAIESVISSAIPRDGRLLVAVNGAYGRRIAQMARVHGIGVETLDIPESQRVTADGVAARLAASTFTHVAVIHCETTTGTVNPIEEIGAAVAGAGAVFIVDAMSSFGAIPISLEGVHADFLISSANKCIEGVPGFGFILARRGALLAAKGHARTLSVSICTRNGPAWKATGSSVSLLPPMFCWHSSRRWRSSKQRVASAGAPPAIAATTKPSCAGCPSWGSTPTSPRKTADM